MEGSDRTAYRPFRTMGYVLASALAFLVVWLPLVFVTGGFQMGPAEKLRFSSLEEAQQEAFSNYGAAWPGSQVEVQPTSTGYVIDRRWLWWTEVSLPLDHKLSTNTARYELGAGDTVQQVVITLIALIPAAFVFVALRRQAQAEVLSKGLATSG